ncbi:spore germination protein [Bacillus sp. CGMCC 1.16541]|uniref:spore germination protein n=1 Tax=Bacillus sp. CGMCC 1.16541 TaxID=2185143 RepID=UPI0013A53A34|nr:spore germination protein [Bacillus sp. CGMCC 1.16541]
MPVFIKSVYIKSVEGGIVNFGDIYCICPKTVEKTVEGAGAANTSPIDTINETNEMIMPEE